MFVIFKEKNFWLYHQACIDESNQAFNKQIWMPLS